MPPLLTTLLSCTPNNTPAASSSSLAEDTTDTAGGTAGDTADTAEDTADTTGDTADTADFIEDFTSLDPDRWHIADWQLGDTQLSADRVSIADGVLTLEHQRLEGTWSGGEVYSAENLLHGTWTARLAAPSEPGTICAFFFYQTIALQDTWFVDEIDFEVVAGQVLVGTYALWRPEDGYESGPTRQVADWWSPPKGMDLSDFHDYQLVWSADAVTFTIDDQLIATISSAIPANPMQIHFNHWTSSTWKDVGTPASGDPMRCRVDSLTGDTALDRTRRAPDVSGSSPRKSAPSRERCCGLSRR